MNGQFHAPAALARGKSPRHPSDRRFGGPLAGLDDVEEGKLFTLPGLELRHLSRYTDCAIQTASHLGTNLYALNKVSQTLFPTVVCISEHKDSNCNFLYVGIYVNESR
jgi:hypothetical protein